MWATASDHSHRCPTRKNWRFPTRCGSPPPNTCSESTPTSSASIAGELRGPDGRTRHPWLRGEGANPFGRRADRMGSRGIRLCAGGAHSEVERHTQGGHPDVLAVAGVLSRSCDLSNVLAKCRNLRPTNTRREGGQRYEIPRARCQWCRGPPVGCRCRHRSHIDAGRRSGRVCGRRSRDDRAEDARPATARRATGLDDSRSRDGRHIPVTNWKAAVYAPGAAAE